MANGNHDRDASWIALAAFVCLGAHALAAPSITIDPVQSIAANQALQVRARVASGDAVDALYLHARGELDTDFRAHLMRPDHKGSWTAALDPTPQRGQRLVFFVEALDASGEILATAGSPHAPWVVRVVEPLPRAGTRATRLGTVLGLAALAVLCGAGGVLRVRSRLARRESREVLRSRDEQFWRRLLDPLFDVAEGTERDAAIEALCARSHDHPDLGTLVLSPPEARRRLEGLQGAPRPKGAVPIAHAARRAEDPLGQVEEDIFWLRLFAPMRAAKPGDREALYHSLSSRPHSHPTKGKVMFDRATLQREFERTRRMNLEQLQLRLPRLEGGEAARPTAQHEAPSAPRASAELPGAAIPAADDPTAQAASATDVASEMFWYNLLAPLRDLPPGLQQDALRELSGRSHRHPVEGSRLFSRAVLAREFAWVQQADPDALQARWNAATLAMLQIAEQGGMGIPEHVAAGTQGPGDEAIDARMNSLFAGVDGTSGEGSVRR